MQGRSQTCSNKANRVERDRVLERGLNEDSQAVSLWLAYIDAQLKHRNMITLEIFSTEPFRSFRVDKLWYKFVYMEETLSNIPTVNNYSNDRCDGNPMKMHGERTSKWNPIHSTSFIFERFVEVHTKSCKLLEMGTI